MAVVSRLATPSAGRWREQATLLALPEDRLKPRVPVVPSALAVEGSAERRDSRKRQEAPVSVVVPASGTTSSYPMGSFDGRALGTTVPEVKQSFLMDCGCRIDEYVTHQPAVKGWFGIYPCYETKDRKWPKHALLW